MRAAYVLALLFAATVSAIPAFSLCIWCNSLNYNVCCSGANPAPCCPPIGHSTNP
ncbi:hypothetical protein GQ42DRAFT_164177 [Ramicandelaber brevisporus]|nr:hypothetical protein GQ42DRAFT_164177 [Ramicandelaber brevisporus]